MRMTGLAVLLIGGLGLTGCAAQTASVTHAAAKNTPVTVAPSPSYTPGIEGGAPFWSGTDKTVTATCVVMSLIETNLSNAESLKADGSITPASYAVVLNTFSSDLTVIASDPGYGLQPEIMALIASTAPASKTLAGGSFDPHGDAFLAPMSQLTTACNTNGSPLHDMDATNPYPNKP